MRLIPGKTKVKIELFKNITIPDVIVGLVGLVLATLCTVTNLPGRWIIALVVAAIFVLLLFRLEDDPMYVFLWHMLRYKAYPNRFQRVYTDEHLVSLENDSHEQMLDAFFNNDDDSEESEEAEKQAEAEAKAAAKAKKKELKEIIKQENKILKSKTATDEEKDAVWAARAARTAEKKKQKEDSKELNASYNEVSELIPFTDIIDDVIDYDGKYYGAVIEIDPIEFRFFSEHRRNNSIERCFGKTLRSLSGDYGANIVKVQRPIVYDEYLDAEYDKLDALRKSFESGLLTEEELKARVEIQYDRINEVLRLCNEEKVIEPFYYLVLFDDDQHRLDIIVRQALNDLSAGELTARRIAGKDLAVFLKYTNSLDFDEKEIDKIPEEQWVNWAMPENLKFSMRRIEINGIITHNLRVISYPSVVGDSWLAGVMSFPSTKVMVKCTPMDSEKSIKTIDRSLAELRGQYMNTSLDSKMLELEEHIDTLSQLLVTLQQDNENLMSVSIYVTAYDARTTSMDPVLGENFRTLMPYVADMKKTVKRSWSEAGMKLSGMDFMQIQAFIGSQVSAYDPMVKEARGIPTNTIAGMFPWIYAHISDKGGIQLGTSDGVPVFIDFFRRDEERVNSNMVIVGKSGSGKSYATKSLLTNLASEDSKIFILDPENEYAELAHTLHGKVINVGNAQFGRINPFHIITALDDDEAGEEGGGPGGSFATHLQFLEEFLRQILPDIDREALEFLNSLIERLYLDFGISASTNLSELTAADYPIFDDLYDIVLSEFERTNNEYLRQLLRSLVNYISKFATGGRNANIWNGPSTITTDENFTVFNFQSMLANRNNTIANAQMLLVLKYIDNEIIKNRDYNNRYGLNRKIVVVIDEAHVFIDTKFPVALDFMFQLAKRIRKYNGMQIVITQNIKDFVGSEEIARKSTAIINACQYSFVFGLAPNDMNDLVKLYEKAGGINEQEQEDILNAKRGQAFTIMSPTSRSSFAIEVPDSFVDMFENNNFQSNYFTGEEGEANWEDYIKDSREKHDANYTERIEREAEEAASTGEHKSSGFGGLTFSEISEGEADALETSYEEDLAEDTEERLGAVDKLIAAEEAVNRKEYELATGRFGGISLQEISEEEADSLEAEEDVEFDEDIEFSPEDTNIIPEIDKNIPNEEPELEKPTVTEAVAPSAISEAITPSLVSAAVASERTYTKEELDAALSQIKDSLREEMSRDLEEKLKWVSLGAAAAGGAVGGVATGMTGGTGMSMPAEEEEDTFSSAFSGGLDSYDNEDYDTDEEEEEEFSFDSDEDYESDEEDYSFDSDEEEFSFDSDDEYDSDEDYDSDEEEFSFDSEDDYDEEDEDYDSEEDEFSSLFDDDEDDDYEPAPFLFAELLAEAAEEYAEMDIEERMEESGEDVMEITVEELADYIKKQRKATHNA